MEDPNILLQEIINIFEGCQYDYISKNEQDIVDLLIANEYLILVDGRICKFPCLN